jgi:hypothetical protein
MKSAAVVGIGDRTTRLIGASPVDARENVRDSSHLRSPAPVGSRVAQATRMDFHRLLHRVQNEFIEMPGLQLTLPQAARLWGLDLDASRRVIDALVEGAFLRWTPQGTVIRAKAS